MTEQATDGTTNIPLKNPTGIGVDSTSWSTSCFQSYYYCGCNHQSNDKGLTAFKVAKRLLKDKIVVPKKTEEFISLMESLLEEL